LEFEMNSRYVLSALAGIFLAVAFVAVVTTVRHLSHHQTVAMTRRLYWVDAKDGPSSFLRSEAVSGRAALIIYPKPTAARPWLF
jgi:hypothetical protein